MPGRAGRSKGCFKCRQRHIKCDETRPGCLRCQKARTSCPGYPETAFVNESAAIWRKRDALPDSSPTLSSPSSSLTVESSSPIGQEMCICFLRQTIEHTGLHRPDMFPGWAEWPGWRILTMSDPLPRLCLDSLAYTLFGRLQHVEAVRLEGSRLYSRALTGLKESLSEAGPENQLSLVISIMTVSVYEYLTATSKTGWIEHALALGTMYDSIGPLFFAKPETIILYETNRLTMALAAIAARTPSFMSQKSWKELPWALSGRLKPPGQVLIDMMADSAGILSEMTLLFQNADPASSTLQKVALQESIVALVTQFCSWKQDWDREFQHDTWEDADASNNHPWAHGRLLQFTSAQIAHHLVIYNACLIVVLEIAREVGMATVPLVHYGAESTQRKLDISEECFRLAMEICRALPFFQTKIKILTVGLTILFPIRMAWRIMRNHDTTLATWLETLLELLSSRTGWQIGEHALAEYPYLPRRLSGSINPG